MKKTHRRGFTLIELLVVVSIIALLVSILLPALAEARRHGKMALDQANLHQIGLSLIMYADENNNNFPRNTVGNWLFDVSYGTSNYIVKTGGDKKIFYCPIEGVKNPDDDIFWRAAECWQTGLSDLGNRPEPEDRIVPWTVGSKTYYVHYLETIFRVTGYFWLFGGAEGFEAYRPEIPFTGQPQRTWVYKSTQRDSADTELVVDITVSMGTNPETSACAGIQAGLFVWGVEDRTAHLTKEMKPRDGNCLYVDGHVARKPFDDMVRRYLIHNPDGVYLPHHWW